MIYLISRTKVRAIIMESRYGVYSRDRSGWTSLRSEEFQEEDVWAVLQGRKDFPSKVGSCNSNSSLITPRQLSTARMVPRASNNTTQEHKIIQQSAPVKIPNWSNMYGKKNSSWLDDEVHHGDDGDGDGEDNVIPPHEWIARKLARSQISSFSVCEGVGRTLKGRDLSRVRNAVLTKTGFLE
ncbi:Valine--tRNA ligase [Actinidia chinensis var. chinensis]|uniref:Valine--tRNA ligase n=1 Tax=Actinidia chinensis var. chinensis TaxID=1590841 RepID=A0A2R6PS65_ACTCC|nr:Valine--tRNA ligase [Actinidia chinensis var. chinensis]